MPHGAPVVGNVAALVPHKGQKHLVAAAAKVHREEPDARVLIVGEGELREPLERQIKDLGLERHVYLAGFRSDALGLMKSFDLFAMSSITEGLGSAMLEAMACRRAIVATRAGGIPEVVVDGQTGLLVPPHDDGALAAAIVRLLRDPSLRQTPRRGRPAAGRGRVQRGANGGEDAGGLRALSRGTAQPRADATASVRMAQRLAAGTACRLASSQIRTRPSCSGGTARSRTARDRQDRASRSARVMSTAIFHPGVVRLVKRRHFPTRIVWVSSGTTSWRRGMAVHPPGSTPSLRTIQRRKRFRRLQAEPVEGRAKK